MLPFRALGERLPSHMAVYHPQTAAVPTLVDSQEESPIDQQLSDDFTDCPIAGEILEVPSYEFDPSLSGSIQVKEKTFNLGMISAPRVLFCLLSERVTRFLLNIILLGFFSRTEVFIDIFSLC